MLDESAQSIHAVSPDTLVFTVFQLERLKGLGGVLNGWTNPPRWNLVDDVAALGSLDAIGFTSYPYFEYATPTQIPLGYYDEVPTHWSGKVFFSEIGWLGGTSFPYPGGEQDQADFVSTFFARTDDLDLVAAVWLFLHDWDQEASIPAFSHIGLQNNDDSVVRLADGAWQSEVGLRE